MNLTHLSKADIRRLERRVAENRYRSLQLQGMMREMPALTMRAKEAHDRQAQRVVAVGNTRVDLGHKIVTSSRTSAYRERINKRKALLAEAIRREAA